MRLLRLLVILWGFLLVMLFELIALPLRLIFWVPINAYFENYEQRKAKREFKQSSLQGSISEYKNDL